MARRTAVTVTLAPTTRALAGAPEVAAGPAFVFRQAVRLETDFWERGLTLAVSMPSTFTLDVVAPLLSFGLWQTFSFIVDYSHLSKTSLTAAVSAERLNWMHRMTNRENRIVDGTLLANLMHSVSFFASATVLILGGVAAMAGAVDHTFVTIQGIPFVSPVSKELFEAKLLLLGLVFIYSFLKFTWSLRQFTYCTILVGGAPRPDEPEQEKTAFAVRAARVNELGARSFNQGLRGYYFALASLGWFIHPLAFVAATMAVVAILWRREFYSRTRRALRCAESH